MQDSSSPYHTSAIPSERVYQGVLPRLLVELRLLGRLSPQSPYLKEVYLPEHENSARTHRNPSVDYRN